jgi:hypothetical protein
VATHAQPSLGNDALQLFVESARPSETQQELEVLLTNKERNAIKF